MKLNPFNRKPKEYHEKKHYSVDTIYYNKADLEKKAEDKVPMTYEELEALNAFHQKDIVNEVLRIVGLIGVLFFIVLAIGTFLYPYSIFNFVRTSAGNEAI